ncbi:uncharacterized protein PRCAT00004663001 [Priceomyces carsonii]|uniref:uncharacterized protein n=1 Tax=Priceomyces carsonii TaxID=28549 RepID=UPI002ED9755E|nr:unnamed protein product [Priceomyces carsonii]
MVTIPKIIGIRWPQRLSVYEIYQKFTCFFPRAFYTSTLAWSIYVLIYKIAYEVISIQYSEKMLGLFTATIGALLCFLCMYTYVMVIVADSGSSKDFEELRIEEMNPSMSSRYKSDNPYDHEGASSSLLSRGTLPKASRPPKELTFHFANPESGFRYCNKCYTWKPDRCHHCSKCGKCVLRMDHHCPWFAICIGFYNQKFFVQFLGYITLYTGFLFIVSLSVLWKFFMGQEFQNSFLSVNIVLEFVLSIAFFVTLGAFFGFLCWAVLKNLTTIEFQERTWFKDGDNGSNFKYEFDSHGKQKRLEHVFDLGYKKNWKSIMGSRWYECLIPCTVTDRRFLMGTNNGINFDVNQALYDKWLHSMELQARLNQQLADYQKRVKDERELM